MNSTSEHESYWSLKLLAVLQQMAEQKTNAVLMLLASVNHLQRQCRYPEAGLLFAGNHWRTFYHCHEEKSMHVKEHGHFHLFTDIGNQAWAHVAGLSIDAEGQPLQWFAVNRWVTDGPWLESEKFLTQLKYAAVNDDDNLAGNWLAAMLQFYHDDLLELLINRDMQMQQNLKGHSRAEILENRDIYTLATSSIDLQSRLEKHLLQNHINVSVTNSSKENIQQGV